MVRASWPLSEPRSPFCPPEEDPFLLLESTQKAIEGILRSHAGRQILVGLLEQFSKPQTRLVVIEAEAPST